MDICDVKTLYVYGSTCKPKCLFEFFDSIVDNLLVSVPEYEYLTKASCGVCVRHVDILSLLTVDGHRQRDRTVVALAQPVAQLLHIGNLGRQKYLLGQLG